ncbi:hypothetical protein HDV57DRAFT_215345 [Trichoderma longibrachiatum]
MVERRLSYGAGGQIQKSPCSAAGQFVAFLMLFWDVSLAEMEWMSTWLDGIELRHCCCWHVQVITVGYPGFVVALITLIRQSFVTKEVELVSVFNPALVVCYTSEMVPSCNLVHSLNGADRVTTNEWLAFDRASSR